MSDFSSIVPSTGPPRSPLFGTATFSTLSPTQTPMSPSRLSSSYRSVTPVASSYDSDDASSGRQMRRIVVSPSPSSDRYTYSEEDSIRDAAEVEEELAQINDDIDDFLTEVSRSSQGASGYSSYTGPSTYTSYTSPATSRSDSVSDAGSGTSGNYRSAVGTVADRAARVLSTISEHTENTPSRPSSYPSTGDVNRLSTHVDGAASHVRAATEPSGAAYSVARPLPSTPGPKVGERIAFFEDRTAASLGSPAPLLGHSRTGSAPSAIRSPSPYTTTQSRSMPTLSSTGYGYGSTTGYGTSRPSSRTGSAVSHSGLNTTMSSLLSPPARTHSALSWDSHNPATTADITVTSRTAGTYTASGTGTYTNTNTFTNTLTSFNTITTPTTTSLAPDQMSPSDRTALSQVRNVINRWKERTPSMGKTERSTTTPSPTQSDGLFSIRRRASRGSARLRDRALQTARGNGRRASDPVSAAGVDESGSGSLSTNGLLPPPFDISEMGQYAGAPETQEPIRIGLLWYLNVHAVSPYRWQRCQALLYPHMLLLSWIAPGGGRGIVTLDLLNCTEVQSAKSPTHHGAQEDVGTLAAIMQSQNATAGGETQLGEAELMETLSPFHLHYSDGIERLGTDSPRERVRWVSAIWDVLDRAVSIPDRSASGSPTGSVRTIRSFSSTGTGSTRSGTASGSATTRYVPHIDTLPDISDLQSISGSSTRTGLSRGPSLSLASAHRTRATDDSAVSNQAFLYPGDPRVIAPSRSSSIRRTSSLTDLDEEFASAVRRARDSRPGLGFGLGLAGGIPVGDGSPVTVSSGPRLGRDVYMSPPPSVGRGSEGARSRASDSATSISDDAFFTAGSATGRSRTPASSFYSSSFTRALTTTDTKTGTGTGIVTDETLLDIVSGTGTNTVTSTLSPRGAASASMLGDSHSGSSGLLPSTSPSRSGLTRSRAVTRRTPRSSSRSYSSYDRSSEDTSDKENTESYTPTASRSYTEGFSTLESYSSSRSYTPTPSSSSYTRSTTEPETRTESEPESVPARSSTTAHSTEYVTARSPSELSYVSLPTIPSLYSDYETAEVCSTEYETAPKCPSEPLSDYETAVLCPTEPGSEYETAEVCPSEAETDYKTAECRCAKPEEREEDEISIAAPSAIPTIPSSPPKSLVEEGSGEEGPEEERPEEEVLEEEGPEEEGEGPEEEAKPEDIPLPESVYSPSVAPTELLEELPSPPEESVPSPSPPEPSEAESSVMSIPGPSPIPTTESPLGSLPSVSTISTATESSVTPTPTDLLTPSVPSSVEQPPTPSSPAVPESLWGIETDQSYESSLLRASPSVQSLALPEGADTSFETSFLRPSGSPYTEEDISLLTPITEISTESDMTMPSSPSKSITPTPSTISLPPSVPSPTPIPTEAPVPTVMLTRTPSTVSTVSSISMSSSVLGPRSLFEYPLSIADISTEPSLLSTAASPAMRPISPPSVPLPPSPAPTLEPPTPTMSVSITTPRGDIPSIMSTLETIPSEAPSTILTHDVNRLLQYLNDIDTQRGAENRQMAQNVEEIRRLLEELRDNQRQIPVVTPQPVQLVPPVVREVPIPVHVPVPMHMPVPEVPPPVPRKDQSVGGSSVISSLRSTPAGVREMPRMTPRPTPPRLIPIPLTPPPIRMPSPDTMSETMSFLSSHHSDDFSLMESESYPAMPLSPSWPSEPSSSPGSSPLSEPLSLPSRSASLSISPTPTPPPSSSTPSSPTPSAASDRTAVPIPPVNLSSLRDGLAQIREEIATLQTSQAAANEILQELRARPVGQDISDCCRRLEEAIQHILEQGQRQPPPPPPPPPPPVRDDRSESLYPSGSSLLLDEIARMRDELGQEPPSIQIPVPVRAGPSFDEILVGMLSDGQPPPPQPVEQPPPIIPLTYRPGPRPSRPRSASPVFETDLPVRPGTFPVTRPVRFERPERRVPRVQPIPRAPRGLAYPPMEPSEADSYPPQQSLSDPRMPRRPVQPEGDIDFLQRVVSDRHGRHPEAPDGGFGSRIGAAPTGRPPTAPAALGDLPTMPRPVGPQPQLIPGGPPVPPPGAFAPAPAPPPVFQIQFDDILSLLRDNRTAQLASIDQIREVMRYLRDFNEWHGRDVEDRHAEIRGLNARIDHIRDLIYDLMGRREAPPPEQAAQPVPGTGPPMPQPMPQPFPPGFFPQGAVYPQPADIRVIPGLGEDEGTDSRSFTPVIPASPLQPHTPFMPPGFPSVPGMVMPQAPPVVGFSPREEEEGDVVPSPPFSETESDRSEGLEPDVRYIPPPGGQLMQPGGPPMQPGGPITILPPGQQLRDPEVVRMPTEARTERSRSQPPSPTGTQRRVAEVPPSREGSPRRGYSPVPPAHGPMELRPGSPRHPGAPSGAPPVTVVAPPTAEAPMQTAPFIIQPPPMGAPMMPAQPPVVAIEQPSVPYSSPRSEYDDGQPPAEPTPMVFRTGGSRPPSREGRRSRLRSQSPEATHVIVQPAPGQPIAPPSGPPIVIGQSPPPVPSGDVPRSPYDARERDTRRPRSPYYDDRERDRERRPRSPYYDDRYRDRRRDRSPYYDDRDYDRRRPRSPYYDRDREGRPRSPYYDDRDREGRPPSPYYSDRGRRRYYDDRYGRSYRGRIPSRSPSPVVVRTRAPAEQPRTHRSPEGHRSRSPTLFEPGVEPIRYRVPSSQRALSEREPFEERRRTPSGRVVRSPIPEESEEEPYRAPRSEHPEERDYARGPIQEVPSIREARTPPPLPVHIPSRQDSRRGPRRDSEGPTIVDVETEEPLSPHVVRVPSSRPPPSLGRPATARRPSGVTIAPSAYEETTPVTEHAELPGTQDDVSEIGRAYGVADGVSRAPTQRSARSAAAPTVGEHEPRPGEYATTEPAPTRVPPPHLVTAGPEYPEYEEPYEEEPYERAVPPATPSVSRRPTVATAPPGAVEQYRASGPGALGFEDAERERQERFGELERQAADTLATLQEAEAGRDQEFRGNEDERQRIFEDHEARRAQEAIERRDAIWQELEDRLATIVPQVPIPVPPPGESIVPTQSEAEGVPSAEEPTAESPFPADVERPADLQSVVESIRIVAQDAASRHAQEILETVRLEREELTRERELAQAERERQQAESEAARARYDEDREARIRALEEELAAVRAELENERQLRLTEETERRERERVEMIERDEVMRAQLSDITNLVSEQREELIRKRELMDERWGVKQQWMEQCQAANNELRELVQQVITDRAADKAVQDEEREARANDPTIQSVLDEMAAFRREQDELLRQMAETWRADCARQHEETLNAVRSTAHEQVPFNIQGYLDEFSRSLAAEVRMLLGEVGRLREERRNIQYELGCLLTMKSKMGPGGEFDPDWRPPTGPCARDGQTPAPEAPPPEAPPPDEPPAPARPAWRSVIQRGSRRSRRSQAAAPPPPAPVPEVRAPVESWATWQPHPAFVPTPPPNPPQALLVPDQPSPGLFGPRSPRSSIHRP